MKKFRGYEVVGKYPRHGWLKGYFYVSDEDILGEGKRGEEAYRDLSAIRHKDMVLHLLDIKPGEKVLDVGCEAGAMMTYCGLLGGEVSGIDLCPESVAQANSYMREFGIRGRAVVADAKKLPFPDNYFDKAVSSDFFEHLSRQDNIESLKEIKRVLKPSGKLVVKTPNLTYLRAAKLLKQIICVARLENPLKVIIPHTKGESRQHIGLSSRRALRETIKAAGFINFKSHFSLNSKLERSSFGFAECLAGIPILKDIVTEELIIETHKPVILSFFP